jgi:hypothetical protein
MFKTPESRGAAEPEAIDPEVQRQIHRRVDDLPSPSWRRRLLLVLLALGMGYLVVTTMIDPPGNILRNPPPRVDAPRCLPGQTMGCVGGTALVIVAPPAAAASR